MSSSGKYRVEIIGSVESECLAIAHTAARYGPTSPIAASLKLLFQRLKRDPRNAGDPIYHFRKMDMTIFNNTTPPLYFEYGVHDDNPEVVNRRVVWLADPRWV